MKDVLYGLAQPYIARWWRRRGWKWMVGIIGPYILQQITLAHQLRLLSASNVATFLPTHIFSNHVALMICIAAWLDAAGNVVEAVERSEGVHLDRTFALTQMKIGTLAGWPIAVGYCAAALISDAFINAMSKFPNIPHLLYSYLLEELVRFSQVTPLLIWLLGVGIGSQRLGYWKRVVLLYAFAQAVVNILYFTVFAKRYMEITKDLQIGADSVSHLIYYTPFGWLIAFSISLFVMQHLILKRSVRATTLMAVLLVVGPLIGFVVLMLFSHTNWLLRYSSLANLPWWSLTTVMWRWDPIHWYGVHFPMDDSFYATFGYMLSALVRIAIRVAPALLVAWWFNYLVGRAECDVPATSAYSAASQPASSS